MVRVTCKLCLIGALYFLALYFTHPTIAGEEWPRHIIDDSSRGADGVKVADVNADGLMDIVTGWEEGGLARVYLHPGYGKSKSSWPAVTVGNAPDAEDGVFIDLDNDGDLDVVTTEEQYQGKGLGVVWYENPSKSTGKLR